MFFMEKIWRININMKFTKCLFSATIKFVIDP